MDHDRRLVWLAAAVFLGLAGRRPFADDFVAPEARASTRCELLEERFPEAANGQRPGVRRAEGHGAWTGTGPPSRAVAGMEDVEHVAGVRTVEPARSRPTGASATPRSPSTRRPRELGIGVSPRSPTRWNRRRAGRPAGRTRRRRGVHQLRDPDLRRGGGRHRRRVDRAGRRVRNGRWPHWCRSCSPSSWSRRTRRDHPAGQRDGRLHRRADGGRDGRPRRRHRLRAVHRGPIPREPRRRAGTTDRGLADAMGAAGVGGRVRRRHHRRRDVGARVDRGLGFLSRSGSAPRWSCSARWRRP